MNLVIDMKIGGSLRAMRHICAIIDIFASYIYIGIEKTKSILVILEPQRFKQMQSIFEVHICQDIC